MFIHYPNEVWMRDTYCVWESWRKVKIWNERAGDISLEHLYHEPIVPLAQKVRDLKEMALTHVPSPQRDIYLNLANSHNGSDPDNQDSETKV